jgi:hypothetical protein
MNRNDILNLPQISLYSFENLLKVYNDENSGYNFYNLLRSINVVPTNNDLAEDQYITVFTDTWVSISYKHYNTMDLWWLVCVYNQISDATKRPEPGTVLKLLKSQYVGVVLSELKKQINK